MFCPKCKAEYRQGFTRCSDCGVDLVYVLPVQATRTMEAKSEPEEPNERIVVLDGTEFKALGKWADPLCCADACLRLRNASVAYRVNEIPQVLGSQMTPRKKFEIAVPVAQYEKAKEILGIEIEPEEEGDLPSGEEIQAVMELRAEDGVPTPEKIHDNWDLANWYPEDATVEVWVGDESRGASDKSWIIELALNEHHIRSRADVLDDGTRHFFVRPEDHRRAREIVREIVEGDPPE